MAKTRYVRWFDSIRLKDLPEVGGKNASLGELYALLAADAGRVPDGFAVTAHAYRDALDAAGAWEELRRLISDFDHHDVALLAERAAGARQLVYEATGNPDLRAEIAAAYSALEEKYGANVAVAVRSSANRRGPADGQLRGPAREFPQHARRGRSDRDLPAVFCVDFHPPRDRLPHR